MRTIPRHLRPGALLRGVRRGACAAAGLGAALAAVVALAAVGGSARAGAGGFAVLPGAEAPNRPGAVVLDAALLRPPPAPARRTPEQLARLWRAAGDTYAVPWQLLAAVNAVETGLGRDLGPSSAGALGWMQFMPATWERWGVDADGDGIASPWSPEDAIYAAARYLAAAGGAGPAGDLPRAVFAYNHAGWYVDRVLALAAVYERGGAQLAFGLEQLAARLAEARARLAAAGEALLRARAERLPAARGSRAATARTARAARLVALQADVDAAAREVARLESRAAGASFSPALSGTLGGPQLAGGYAFPVGGGATAVSVAAGHHDYPAADIAAPAGSPVYALAAGVVERAWPVPDPRCGIGLLLRTADGRGWVYCHLAVLEAGVTAGLRVGAGSRLGLVGSTGESTGPHLHLQLEGAQAFPQREAWFAAFAGSAFLWQAGTAATASPFGGFTVVDGPVDVILLRGALKSAAPLPNSGP